MKKIKLIDDLVHEISRKKVKYMKRWRKLKKVHDVTESVLICCGSIAITNLVITLALINPVTLIIGSVFSAISTVGSATKNAYRLQEKIDSLKTTYQQLSELEREVRSVLVKNHLTSEEYDQLLTDINHRLALIEDSAVPLKI
jgi:prefoldin subunit 5